MSLRHHVITVVVHPLPDPTSSGAARPTSTSHKIGNDTNHDNGHPAVTSGPPASNEFGPSTSQRVTGWLFVLAQILLFVVLVAQPGGESWPVPTWLSLLGYGAMVVGGVVAVIAGLRLGPSLTPTPVPTSHGQLTTTGFYRFSRHPIYSGVLLIVAGLVVRSGNLATLAVGLVGLAFFTVKARWEEDRLRERYPDYDAYAATVGRFLPRLR